ncbi:MAG: hypothetical protein ACLFVO_15650 [Chloroflexaceae bacterium]
MASMGLISNDSIQSIGYLSGWIVSGLVLVGDIRDSIAALARGDLIDTVLNALGLIPLLGDGSKAARVIAEFLQWAPDLIRPVTRWIATTFADHPQVFTAAAAVVGFGGQRLRNLPANEIAQLAKAGNRGDVLEEFLERGGEFISRQLSQSQVDDLYNNKVKVNWDTTKNYNVAQAMAVEAAEDFLISEGYRVLYVGRNTPLPSSRFR